MRKGHLKDKCKFGHSLSSPNLYISPKNVRQCIQCRRRRKKKFHEENKNKESFKLLQRRQDLKKYGISPSDYELLFEQQNGKCKICEAHQSELHLRLAVDHNHKTGKIRSLLCSSCNTALGLLKDSSVLAYSLYIYLKAYNED